MTRGSVLPALLVTLSGLGTAVMLAVAALQGASVIQAGAQLWAQLWAQLAQMGVIAAVGVAMYRTQRRMELTEVGRLARHEEREKAQLKEERLREEQYGQLKAQYIDLDQRLDSQDQVLNQIHRHVIGDDLTVGVIESQQDDADRRHELMTNFTTFDGRHRVMVDVLCELAKASNIAIDAADLAALRQPIVFEPRRASRDRRRPT